MERSVEAMAQQEAIVKVLVAQQVAVAMAKVLDSLL